jgi:hypothetical protein
VADCPFATLQTDFSRQIPAQQVHSTQARQCWRDHLVNFPLFSFFLCRQCTPENEPKTFLSIHRDGLSALLLQFAYFNKYEYHCGDSTVLPACLESLIIIRSYEKMVGTDRTTCSGLVVRWTGAHAGYPPDA